MQKFPVTVNESLVQFKIVAPGEPENGISRTGALRIDATGVTLEVSPEFTSLWDWEKSEGGGFVSTEKVSELDNFVVSGALAMSPQRVTLWGVRTRRSHTVGWAQPGEMAQGSQEMTVRWCLAGDFIPDPKTEFDRIFLDVTNLHDWTAAPSTKRSVPVSGSEQPHSWLLDLPRHEPQPLKDGVGQLILVAQARSTAPSNDGFSVSTNTRAQIVLDSGSPLLTILTDLANPLKSLMTVLSGKESPLRGMELRHGDDFPVHLYGTGVDGDASQSSGELLLRRHDVEAELLVNWLGAAKELDSVPEVLASVWAGTIPTVETECLTLATAAEALHELLYPREPRFDPEDVEQSKSALEGADMPQAVKASLLGALSNYQYGKSYKQRIGDLAIPVADAVPSCIGAPNKWRNAVVSLRQKLAHGASRKTHDTAEAERLATLTRSLRWALTFRLLLHCGVTPDELGRAADNCQRYQKDARKWTRAWGNIYAPK